MFIGFSSVVYDQREGLFKIWYSLHPGEGGDELARLCYATSRDGIRWQKPPAGKGGIGRQQAQQHRDASQRGDQRGLPRRKGTLIPDRRYKMLHMWQGYKVYASHSADGLNWKPYNQGHPVLFVPPRPRQPHGALLGRAARQVRGHPAGPHRTHRGSAAGTDHRPGVGRGPGGGSGTPRRERHPRNHSLRRVGQAISRDFVHWTDYRPILGADARRPPSTGTSSTTWRFWLTTGCAWA